MIKKIEQYRINRLLQQDQKSVYQKLNGKVESSETPDTGERRRFWIQERVTQKMLNG